MDIREQIATELQRLNEAELVKVANFLALLHHTKESMPRENGKREDSIFGLGKNPVKCDSPDASENLDSYLY